MYFNLFTHIPHALLKYLLIRSRLVKYIYQGSLSGEEKRGVEVARARLSHRQPGECPSHLWKSQGQMLRGREPERLAG